MKYSRRVIFCLLGFIICINILYRYPTFSHEVGFDTFYMHNLADSISYHGNAKWIINPLSYFGMYAFSYPSAMPFYYSETSLMTGVDIEASVLLIGMLFGVAGGLFAYLTAREIKDNDIIAFFAGLFFSTAPFLLNITTWEGSGKGYVVLLLPMYLFFLVKHLKTANTKFLILALALLAVMSTIHRIGYIAVFVFFAYLFTLPLHNITRYIITPDIKFRRAKKYTSFIAVSASFGLALALLYISPGFLGSSDVTRQYAESSFFSGSSPLITLANMGVSYTGKLGVLVPIMFFGVFGLAWQERRSVPEKFFILSIVFLMPFIPMREYMTAFFISIFSILLAFSIYYLAKFLGRRKRLAATLVVTCIVVTMGFSWTMKDYWRVRYDYNLMSENTYETGIYVKHSLSRTDMFIANKGYVSLRVTAISGIVSLPLGGASGASYNAQQLVYDQNFDINRNELDIKPVALDKIGYDTNEIFMFNDPGRTYDAELNWANILDRPCDGPNSHIGKYTMKRLNIHYAFETHDLDGQYVFWSHYWSPFLGNDIMPNSVHHNRYMVYNCNEAAMWYV